MASAAPVAEPQQWQPPAGPAILFEDVSIGFEGKPVLDRISFKLEQGETRILLGPAGVGKSVLLKLANGLLKPDSGRITVFGEEVSAMREQELFRLRHHIGMVFQEGALFDSLTVRDNVGYQLMEEHVPDEEIDERVKEALRVVELEHTMEKVPSELSGGMRRRVAIARAVVSNPALVLYDSPTGGLDPITSTTIIELVVKQRDVFRRSSLMITHRLQDAFVMAMNRYNEKENRMELLPEGTVDDRTSFLMLNEGKLVFDGSTHDLVHSDDPFISRYIR
ncbi:MAG: ATP-binding cassette domain-containing protein [Acidobacteria bacterium]|nr:ATP-binding cassette domain-containing protein [Acidobacteriota bacterium]